MTISYSVFHRKIKNWIFQKSTQNGLLKNVQYGISRPLGSREIKKTNKSGHCFAGHPVGWRILAEMKQIATLRATHILRQGIECGGGSMPKFYF